MTAGKKWISLLLDILGYEFDDGPFLSDGAHELVDRHPIMGRFVILFVCGVLTVHLAKLVEPQYDLMHVLVTKRVISK